MNIDGDSRKQIIDFLLLTSQLNQQEYNIVKKNMVSLLFFMKPTLEPLQFANIIVFGASEVMSLIFIN